MPWDEVMHKFGKGELHSGSKSGKKVSNRKQAIAIMMSEKHKAAGGDEEYQPIGPSKDSRNKMAKKHGKGR